MSTDQDAGLPSSTRPKDSQAEILALVEKSQRIKSEIASLNSEIAAVDEAIDTPARTPHATPPPHVK